MSQNIWDLKIDQFLGQAASSAPTPGGGSVSAYAGALAASMVCMVSNLTIGKEKYKDVESEVKDILQRTEELLSKLQAGLTQDIQVFSEFMAALKLPKESETEKMARAERLQEVLITATEVPLGIARNSFEVLELARELAPIGNKGAISDVGVAAYLAESALKSAMLSVDINLPQIKNEDFRNKVTTERTYLFKEAERLAKEAVSIVQSRL